jgi:hypothetical protein
VTDGPAHPYVNNEVAREMKIPPSYRVADLRRASSECMTNVSSSIRSRAHRLMAAAMQ